VTGQATIPAFYTVKRVDNSRLRREVNPEHHRECLAVLGLSVVVFIFVFLFAWQHFQCVRSGYRIEELKAQFATLEEWNHQLRLEHSGLVDPQRIDTLARHAGLASPSPQQVIQVGPSGPAPVEGPQFARNLTRPGPAQDTSPSGQ